MQWWKVRKVANMKVWRACRQAFFDLFLADEVADGCMEIVCCDGGRLESS